jgi:hypothetical protein
MPGTGVACNARAPVRVRVCAGPGGCACALVRVFLFYKKICAISPAYH